MKEVDQLYNPHATIINLPIGNIRSETGNKEGPVLSSVCHYAIEEKGEE